MIEHAHNWEKKLTADAFGIGIH